MSKSLSEPMTGGEITGLTVAGATLTMLQVVINVFIAYYYTNVVGISTALVGTLLLVTRVADAFSDLGMGVVIAKTSSKYGKARPWGIRMALPLLASVLLTFFVPAQWTQQAKSVYACVTYFLMITVAITPAGIVGSVLGTNMTSHPQSRQKCAVFSSIFVMIGSVAGNLVVIKMTETMGDTFATWRLIAAGFGLLAFAGQVVQFLLTKERIAPLTGDQAKAKNLSLKEAWPALAQNKYFLIMCLVGVFGALDGAMAGCIIYYVKYVLSDMSLVGLIGIVTLIPTLAGIMLVPLATKKIPAKNLILAGLLIKMITFLINVCLPGSRVLFIALAALRSLAGSPLMVYGGVYLLNTIEYGERKTGIRANSLIISVSSVASKIGSGLGGAAIGWLLGLGGYVGVALTQTASAQQMIIYINFLIPLAAVFVQFILLCGYQPDTRPQTT